jgi:glycogen debranching enzyme
MLGPMADDVPGLRSILPQEGWPYTSAPPVEPGDPGRFHVLFGRDSLIASLQLLPARPHVVPRFDPHAYHRGSVWPFDSWLGWGGLRAAGRLDAAERVRRGALAALDRLGRFPELHAVVDGEPEAIPISNRVQAWTVGARWALEHERDGHA